MLFRGKELVTIQEAQTSEHGVFMWKLDYAMDIQPEDYNDLRFLSVKQVGMLSLRFTTWVV